MLRLWQFELLSQQQGITHFVSGRNGGVSAGDVGSLNFSYKVGDIKGNVDSNRDRLSQALGISSDKLIFPEQTHSNNVRLVKTAPDNLDDTDAVITNIKGLAMCVMSADCVPILLFDKDKKAIGAVHAGWKGTVGKILTHTIDAMKNHFSTNPENIIACIGPSISKEVYEVGLDVISEVERAYGNMEGLISNINKEGKGNFNLWKANKRQLTEAGVKDDNIEIAGICSYTNSDKFFSARKSKNKAGRFAAGIMLV